jgi:DNA-binding winged helix-turn-helix (wHTH) protein/Tol biopolymer transport system component
VTERKCFIFSFANVEVREREFLLIKGGERLPVEPKAFRVLLFLLRNPGRLVTKDEIVSSVWNDSAVSDNSLTRSMAQLRRVLDDDPREPRYILTVPTLGYRFLCEVQAREDGFGAGVAAGDTPAGPQAGGEGARPGDQEKRRTEISGSQKRQRRRFIYAVAAVLLISTAGWIGRRIIGAHSGVSPYPPHLATEQRLTANSSEVPVNGAVVSRDGRYLAYADPSGLYLRQISNGETRPWSLPKGFLAFPMSWFPDGTHVLAVRVGQPSWDFSQSKPRLYRLSILGGEPQEIMSDTRAGYVSPDGSRIAYLTAPNVTEMWIMDSDGANPRKVTSTGEEKKHGNYPNWIDNLAWSPTGQHLAYIESHGVEAPSPVGPTHTLRIVDPNGEGATVALDDPRIGVAIWWAPDGRILFSYRDDHGNDGVYSIRLDERTGKAPGPPQPITQAEGNIGGISGTADGKRLVLWRTKAAPQVFITSLDTASHQWKEPRRLTLDDNENIADTWTADSKAVLFVSNRNGTWKLFKQAIDETTPQVLAEGRSIATPRLSADGLQVLYLYSSNPEDVSFPSSLVSKPLAGGAPRTIIEGKGLLNHQCAMAPSMLCIFSQHDGQDIVFRSFDLEHGVGRELIRIRQGFEDWNWSLSPDGSKLAMFRDQHRIRFVSLASGAAHDVTVKDWSVYNGDWAANNETVLSPSNTPDGLPVILEIDQGGKAKVVLQGSRSIGFGAMIQSPDARYALVDEGIPTDNNAWIVNDF